MVEALKPSLMQRLDLYGRMSLPMVLTLLMVLIMALPKSFPAFGDAMPALSLMAIFYWSIQRPDLMPGWVVFLTGLFEDLLTGAPLGLNVGILLLIHVVIASQRRFFLSRPFSASWGAFALVALFAMIIKVMLHNALTGYMTTFENGFIHYMLTVSLYPILAWILALAQQKFLQHDDV